MNVSRLLSSWTLLALCLPAISREMLTPRGAESKWQYNDSSQPVDKAWATPAFDGSKWKTGPAPLGYGEEELSTTITFGSDENDKPVTTYFRRVVEVTDPDKVANIVFHLRRDDGSILYWNGTEVARSNLPQGEIKPNTPAPNNVNGRAEEEFHVYIMPAKGKVVKGANLIAVEVHQNDPASSDLIFDLEAVAYAAGEALPDRAYYKDTIAALQSGNRDRALELMLKLDPARHDYIEFMSNAIGSLPPQRGPPDERYFTLVDKLYNASPSSMALAYTWVRARVDARRDFPIKPARRTVPATVPEEFRFIADTPPITRSGPGIARAKLLADVDDLELILENCYSYLERRGANYRGALDALRASITGDLSTAVFAHRVSRMLTVFGDPHTAVRGGTVSEARVTALFVMDGNKLAALVPDHTQFFVPGFPYLTEIKGRPANEWLTAAEHIVPQASPQYRRYLALRQLREMSPVARELRFPSGSADEFPAVFTSADGKEKKTVNLTTGGSRNAGDRIEWPDTGSQILQGDIGYLRIPQMSPGEAFISSLNEWMKKFDETKGLIIDVRGNSGGTQDAIRTLLPWFMKPKSPLKIINIAAYRLPLPLPKPNPSGFLGLFGRGLHPATSSVWTPAQAAQIETFLSSWKPKWKLPPGKFSEWHVMAISHELNPSADFYDKPVIVLSDARCFSATDNFLGALKGHPNVTIMGTTSGGGSGRMAEYTLPNTGLSLTLCQMASFAANGETYDGVGVAPDIVMEGKLDDQIDGKGDSVLQAAVARLKKL